MHAPSRIAGRLLAPLALLLLAACASGPKVTGGANPSLDLAQYRTFAFHAPLATDRGGSETALTKRLKQATRRNLEAKGYVYAETDPDLLVSFFANLEAKSEIHSTASAPVGYATTATTATHPATTMAGPACTAASRTTAKAR